MLEEAPQFHVFVTRVPDRQTGAPAAARYHHHISQLVADRPRPGARNSGCHFEPGQFRLFSSWPPCSVVITGLIVLTGAVVFQPVSAHPGKCAAENTGCAGCADTGHHERGVPDSGTYFGTHPEFFLAFAAAWGLSVAVF